MRGSRPGERRGGRQKGTPNKKTAYLCAVVRAHASGLNVAPLDVMLAVMRDPHVALDMRVKMALKALPYLHRKLRAGEVPSGTGDESLRVRHQAKPCPGAQRTEVSSIGGPARQAAEITDSPATSNTGERPRSVASVDVLMAKEDGARNPDLMPLPFLLGVLNDAKVPAMIKVKVSSATLPYTNPRQSKRDATPKIFTDRCGFSVDRALAGKLRNEIARLSVLKKRRNPTAKDQRNAQKLSEKIDAKLATLQCPSPEQYKRKDAARDKERILYLWRKRRSRAKLTLKEDSELAHVNARYWAFKFGPENRARKRLQALNEKARIHRQANGPSLSPSEEISLRVLAVLYPPLRTKPNADREALLERESIFSECLLDFDGAPMEYLRPDLLAPETIS